MNNEVYYIGFNANNAICNENFFSGSITLYPTGEKGNICFSDKLLPDSTSKAFLEKYKTFIYNNCKQIQKMNFNANFICFNEKATNLCSSMKDINIVKGNNSNIIKFLNNKFKSREFVKSIIPILDYSFDDSESLCYDSISEKTSSSKFVIQEANGAGGDTTYLIDSNNTLSNVKKENCTYCVSKYINNIPLNITLIIGDKSICYLPMSAQLIKVINNRFKYVGADFKFTSELTKYTIDTIYKYSESIANMVKSTGYRGILGIDYVLDENEKIYFMEFNPRFQSSSFLISRKLEEIKLPNIANLHYQAIMGNCIPEITDFTIGESFLNCNVNQQFNNILNYEIVNNGYFSQNPSSFYRKVLKRSIIHEDNFEKIK